MGKRKRRRRRRRVAAKSTRSLPLRLPPLLPDQQRCNQELVGLHTSKIAKKPDDFSHFFRSSVGALLSSASSNQFQSSKLLFYVCTVFGWVGQNTLFFLNWTKIAPDLPCPSLKKVLEAPPDSSSQNYPVIFSSLPTQIRGDLI